VQAVIGEPAQYSSPVLSPDDVHLAVTRSDSGSKGHQIWLFDLRRGATTRFTLDDATHDCPTWSPDGHRLYFGAQLGPVNWQIRRKPLQGANSDEILFQSETPVCPQAVSPDEKELAFFADNGLRMRVLSLSGDKRATELTGTPRGTFHAQWSPDGGSVAYVVATEIEAALYAQTYPDTGHRWQITAAGAHPKWRSDGKELYYLAQDGKLMAVDVNAGSGYKAMQSSRTLFPTEVNALELTRHPYAVSRDGQRFLFASPVRDGGPAPITVVLNWAVEHQGRR